MQYVTAEKGGGVGVHLIVGPLLMRTDLYNWLTQPLAYLMNCFCQYLLGSTKQWINVIQQVRH